MPKEIEIEIKNVLDKIDRLESKDNKWLILLIYNLCKQVKKQNQDFAFELEITCDGCGKKTRKWTENHGMFFC